MKFNYLLIFFLFLTTTIFSQEKQKILFTIDEEPFYTNDFLRVYSKNLNLVKDVSNNNVKNYLQLYVDFKLKIKEAKALGLDTLPKFKSELNSYKNKLILPYLKDEKISEKLVLEAYERLQKEVNVSHILVFLKSNATPLDTLKAYNQLIEARNLILNGEDFELVAKKYSKDPSAQRNGGNLGYFTAFQMVYPFENAAFSTPKNSVSMPFRTKFGYHILKVNNIRKSRGEIEVAHIMLKNDKQNVKDKIDSIYKQLAVKNIEFAALAKKYSEDKASAKNGGKLPKFSSGQMVEEFANVAFSIQNEGNFSKPFKTQFGWHIVKLLKKYPIENFDKVKDKLLAKVASDERSKIVDKTLINKLLKKYKIAENAIALEQFGVDNWRINSNKFNQKLFTIESKDIFQTDFINFLIMNNRGYLKNLYLKFKEQELIKYYRETIEFTNLDVVQNLEEYKEGSLLFDLLKSQVWQKAKDSTALLNFYKLHKNGKYATKKLESIKGVVITDYQNYLEQQLVIQLRKKYKVKYANSEKKKVLKLNL